MQLLRWGQSWVYSEASRTAVRYFEARSAFDSFGRRISDNMLQSPAETPTFGQYYIDPNGQMVPTIAGMPSGQGFGMAAFGMHNHTAFNGMPSQVSSNMPQHSSYSMASPTMSQDGYSGPGNGYEGSSYAAAMMGQDRTPKGTAPTLSGYGQDNTQGAWPTNGYIDPYSASQYQYPDYNAGYGHYYGGQMMQPMSPMGYSAFPPQSSQTFNQAYFANAFNDQHFNPQSQAFIPNVPQSNEQQYGSPQNIPSFVPNAAAAYSVPRQPPNNFITSPPQQSNGHRSRTNNKPQNTISKWPTPASLPAKPPQPTSAASRPQHEAKQSLPPKPMQHEVKQPLPPKPIPSR